MQEKDISGEMWEKISKIIFSIGYSCLMEIIAKKPNH